jgi:hypothetical protein
MIDEAAARSPGQHLRVGCKKPKDPIVRVKALYLQNYCAPVADRGSGTGATGEVRRFANTHRHIALIIVTLTP